MADPSDFDPSGRTVLAIGASSGFGRRFAQPLGALGVGVVLGARRVDSFDSAVAAIRSKKARQSPSSPSSLHHRCQ
jgi:NAD(P)-dependent dehydrogenase (short-subunit alcohol dehydrogenase family)